MGGGVTIRWLCSETAFLKQPRSKYREDHRRARLASIHTASPDDRSHYDLRGGLLLLSTNEPTQALREG